MLRVVLKFKNLSQNLGCRNSYKSIPTIKSVRKSINQQSAGISTLYYELMK
ncbi:hypothetical protein LEP1GSC103_1339 [Leptospira borgpetersenii serovar Javanica str. UI 09931]|uniref:Uncharacterized protein n=3 Tax=Leptospira borgpetersenii TaxID=174 RepID=A0A0S2IUY7_LEPBO|nr:hypothetical protein LBBP_02907 [Leptospira borgpetersenii serovar Ballum]EKP15101.1 hypothetical protein LEP1GSC128_2435 [Leptospira borgpetersenii str. 200801926]EKQ90262.1 hypothetical protein LEP1GSC101_2228 [Leptospira borgpetersenii str. UI 09149]EKQ99354.1 hypothetical protein LEP1GSC121_2525 [Leptospira borgpetersenii serovar Castellonis str. 200801910]EMO11089.1 hypothetical protein LEP1GSC137_4123 [Leptospira borgpetersenii str. Noumea 25]ENO64696.1 hypothetical protein LEP1GSC191